MPGTNGWDSAQALRDVGLRVTRQRVAVLDILHESPHATADAITTATRERLGSVSGQAVYDVLAACADSSLVRRIQPAGSPARFETRTDDNHHHLVCGGCGRIEDVDCVVGAAPCLTPSDDHGYATTFAEVVFWGTFPECANRTAGPVRSEPTT